MKLLKSTDSTTRSFLLLLSFIFANTFVQSVYCFLGDVPRVGPSQKHLEKSQLQIQLILENTDNVPMALKGLTLELTDMEYSRNEKGIQIRQTPSYIGIDGETQVAMESGRWEMRWNDPELESKYQYDGVGNLICRFEIPHEVQRSKNGAKLPRGMLCLSFYVWTKEAWDKNWQAMNDLSNQIIMLEQQKALPKNKNILHQIIDSFQIHYDRVELRNAIGELRLRWSMTPDKDEILFTHDDDTSDGLVLWNQGVAWTVPSSSSEDGEKSSHWISKLTDVDFQLLGKARVTGWRQREEQERIS